MNRENLVNEMLCDIEEAELNFSKLKRPVLDVEAYVAEILVEKGWCRNPVNIGDTVYYCYDLFGEYLIQEMVVTEFEIKEGELHRIRAKSFNGMDTRDFVKNHPYNSLDVIRFTKAEADKWLEEK